MIIVDRIKRACRVALLQSDLTCHMHSRQSIKQEFNAAILSVWSLQQKMREVDMAIENIREKLTKEGENMHCPIEQGIKHHLAQEEQADNQEEGIEAYAAQLLKDEYAPFTPQNFCEALYELTLENVEALCKALSTDDFQTAGTELKKLIFDYWKISAREQAQLVAEEMQKHSMFGVTPIAVSFRL